MKRISVVLLVLCSLLVAGPAQAQVNLNSLKNKAKNAVKQEVSKQKQSATGTAINAVEGNDKATETKSNTTTAKPTEAQKPAAQPQQAQEKKLKPSAAAIAADPGASDNSVKNGYSKPTAEIRAVFENLDPALFIYKPYYQGDNTYFYYVNDESKKYLDDMYFGFLMKAQEEYGVRIKPIGNFVNNIPGQGDRCVPYGEHVMHAGFAEGMADQGNTWPLNHYLRACSILNYSTEASASAGADAGKLELTSDDNRTIRLIETDSDRLARNRRAQQQARRMIINNAPFGLLDFQAEDIYERYEKQMAKDNFILFYFWEYRELVAMMEGHPDANYGGDAQKQCEQILQKHRKRLEDMNDKSFDLLRKNGAKAKEAASQITMAEIPKAGMNDAALEAKFKSLAMKSQALTQGVEIKKVIIRDAGWNFDRNELGVVTARYKGTYLIYTYNGKTFLKDMSFKQPALGGGSFGDWQYRGIGTETRTITDWK